MADLVESSARPATEPTPAAAVAMTPPPPHSPATTLSYERTSSAADAVFEVSPAGDVVTIDLPPMSNLVFATILVPWLHVIWLAMVMSLVMLSGPRPLDMIWIMVVVHLALTAGVLGMYRLARHRNARRIVRVDGGVLGYANAASGGKFVIVPGALCRRIRVRRPWFRPWTVQIQTEPGVSFLERSVTYKPQLLVIALTARGWKRWRRRCVAPCKRGNVPWACSKAKTSGGSSGR
jgi:hypothetical protein